jgi:hypothetical protein
MTTSTRTPSRTRHKSLESPAHRNGAHRVRREAARKRPIPPQRDMGPRRAAHPTHGHLRQRRTSQPNRFGSIVIRVIEDQISTLRPYNARYTGDHRSIFRKRYAEMITRVSLDLVHGESYPVTRCSLLKALLDTRYPHYCRRPLGNRPAVPHRSGRSGAQTGRGRTGTAPRVGRGGVTAMGRPRPGWFSLVGCRGRRGWRR